MCFVVCCLLFIFYFISFYIVFVQRKNHFIFVGFLFQSLIFRFNYKFSILHYVDYFRLQKCIYFCAVVNLNNTYYDCFYSSH